MIGHRCADHKIFPETETLIIGTFNPNTKTNTADFFYGRGRNHLWDILPTAFREDSLKKKTKEEKIAFIRDKHIDFIDIIWEIESEPPDYTDVHLDRMQGTRWREDIIETIRNLPQLKRVCISRKGFKDVPNIKMQIEKIATYLQDKPIEFKCLHTPARNKSRAMVEWIEFLSTSKHD